MQEAALHDTAPFGVSQYTTWPLRFEEDLALFAGLGIRSIEVCEAKLDVSAPERQLDALKSGGFTVSSVQPRLHSLFPDQPRPQPSDPRERMALLRKSMELFGRHFPGTTLVTIPGAAPGGNYALAMETAMREYSEAARIAADCGVKLALEPLNPILMNIDTFLCSLKRAGQVMEAVDHPGFGLFFDVWHVWEEAGILDLIARYSGRIFGVHINDWRTPRAIGDRYIPGTGEIPLVTLLRKLRDTGYTGAYTLEIFSDPALPDSLWADPAATVRKSKEAFAAIWKNVCDSKTK